MNPSLDTIQASYDRQPYDSQPFLASHPSKIAALGQLFDVGPADPGKSRILEIGCASGGNLIPMALALPEADFVGLDISSIQIEHGQRIISELGLSNIRLTQRSLTEFDASLGQFDYIIAHGVFSWIPTNAQEALFALCDRHLTDNGIAYISYNTFPGWHTRMIARDIMSYHAKHITQTEQRTPQARAILGFLSSITPTEKNAYGMILASELDHIKNKKDEYIAHEYLEEVNLPTYFHEFAERAERHNLQYLCDADLQTMLVKDLAPEIQQTLANIASDVIRYEQFIDFIRNRTFRKSLLVRNGRAISRDISPESIMSLHIGATLKPAGTNIDLAPGKEATFHAFDNISLSTSDPVAKAAMSTLANAWPRTLAFEELFRAALAMLKRDLPGAYVPPTDAKVALATSLLNAFGYAGINLQRNAFAFAGEPGERPVASRLARWQAAHGRQSVTNLRHMPVELDAEMLRLLALLDGSRDRDDLILAIAVPRAQLDQALARLAKLALLEN